MLHILVVEDHIANRVISKAMLLQYGYQPIFASDGAEALHILQTRQVDLAVMDVALPKMDGYTLTSILRENGNNVPVLMVAARGNAQDVHRGFLAGADDYMIKPVDTEELMLRIIALLRRSRNDASRKLQVGGTEMNFSSLSVTVNGKNETLPKKEFLLLFKLLSHPDRIFTRRQLMDDIWDPDSESDERTVDVHINRLRDRFRDSADFGILTIRGMGYKAVLPRKNVSS